MAYLDGCYRPEDRCQGIIEYGSGKLIALAGPRTGKTWSLRKRIRELVLNRGIDAKDIAYITFIREITKKFEEDLEEEFKDEELIRNIRISTLHGIALGLIGSDGWVIGRTGHQEPLTIDSRAGLLGRILQGDIQWLLAKSGIERGMRELRSNLREAKEQWEKRSHEPELSKTAEITLDAFSQLARIYGILDWDQTIVLATQICETVPLAPYLARIKHFLVDEYQDFNPSEQAFLDYMMTGAESIVITGDDDQSLYSGRGASPEAIVALAADGGLDHVNLVYSRRCPTGIIEPANRLLGWMRDDPPELKSLTEGGEIVIQPFKSAKREAEYLAAYIRALLESIPKNAPQEEGIACLFPTNEALWAYQTVLEGRGIRCKTPKIVKLTGQQEWARILFRLAHLRNQPLLERGLLQMFPPVKPRHQRAVIKTVLEENSTVGEAVAACLKRGEWSETAASAGETYQRSMQSLTSGDPDKISACMHEMFGDPVEWLPERIEQFLEQAKASLEDAVDGLLQEIFAPDEATDQVGVSEAVELYTMQGAKGLTRRYVILPGCEELLLPRKAKGTDPEEEKRLFYVAVTRATEKVLITHSWSRVGKGKNADQLCKGKPTGRERCPFVDRLGVPIREMK